MTMWFIYKSKKIT